MIVYTYIKKNEYYDSVTLMVLSKKILEIQGVYEAAVMMGTNHNKELMFNSGILSIKDKNKAAVNDLLIGIKAENQEVIDYALQVLEDEFNGRKNRALNDYNHRFTSVEKAAESISDLNLAVVSVSGRFAKNEVMKCLKNNLHVFLFSDNVSYQEEVEMKEYARRKGLLMMGPDCGTAIINQVALGFANEMDKGVIGLVGASGTGLQEVLSTIDFLDCGISQVLGTGGRDLKDEVGAVMMLEALDMLEKDDNTKVIGIVAKASSRSSVKKIINRVKDFKKPIAACILGEDPDLFKDTNIEFIPALDKLGYRLALLSGSSILYHNTHGIEYKNISRGKYLRGLYTGGTLAFEALLMAKDKLINLYSNLECAGVNPVKDYEISSGHTILDMGDDYFTDGKPHPMIDPSTRSIRILKEIKDPNTAVILLDCILGYGSCDDPAGQIISALEEAKKEYIELPVIIVSICGTKKDYQGLQKSIDMLEQAGVIVTRTNVLAVEISLKLLEALND